MNARINTFSNQFNLNFKFRPRKINLIMRTMFNVFVCCVIVFLCLLFHSIYGLGYKNDSKTDIKKRPRQRKRQEAPQSRLVGCVRDGRHGSPCAPRVAIRRFLSFLLLIVKLESVFNRYARLKIWNPLL